MDRENRFSRAGPNLECGQSKYREYRTMRQRLGENSDTQEAEHRMPVIEEDVGPDTGDIVVRTRRKPSDRGPYTS